MAGKPVADYDRSEADLSHYQDRRHDDWLMYELRFRKHYEDHYMDSGRAWEDYRDSVPVWV